MPQPLSRVRPNATINLSPEYYQNHPKFTAAIITVIHSWSVCDTILSHFASRFLQADFEIVATMFQAIASAEAKRSALLAGAKETLSRDDYKLLVAVLRASKPSRDQRNRFAHHLWGTCPELPDVLLLADPRSGSRFLLDISKILSANPETAGDQNDLSDFDHSLVDVYGKNDFAEATNRATEAQSWFVNLYITINNPSPKHDAKRSELLNQPLIRQHFQKLSNEDNP